MFGRASQRRNYLPGHPGGDYSKTIQQQFLPQERCDTGPSASLTYGSSALPKVLLHSTNSGCAALSHIGWLIQDSQCLISLRSSHSLVSVLKNEYYQTFLFIRYLKKIYAVDWMSTVTVSCYSKLIWKRNWCCALEITKLILFSFSTGNILH